MLAARPSARHWHVANVAGRRAAVATVAHCTACRSVAQKTTLRHHSNRRLPRAVAILQHCTEVALSTGPSRFVKEATLEQNVSWVKQVTGKPVVSVGRFTSPDTMTRLIKQGVLDLVGAARPSIADPFLPRKIDEGREDEIRECIGCNICYTGDQQHVPIRCTQNPTMGEEWSRGVEVTSTGFGPRDDR